MRPSASQIRRCPYLRPIPFYAESSARTRVELEHRHIDRHGPGWEAVTGGVDGPEGWPLYLDRYAALVKKAS